MIFQEIRRNDGVYGSPTVSVLSVGKEEQKTNKLEVENLIVLNYYC